ncbi:MAG: alpha-glucan phosphorylase [Deltaproteobacteria bacterium SG8_13]|nr:MAG: alpha-glucan phosphorylase [Deltaproteobacteria bacterium SG8_13]
MTDIRALFPNLPDRIVGLGELAENLWWSWRPRARMLFKMLDRQAWKDSGHNPDKMLRELPAEILNSAAVNPDYLRHYDVVLSIFRNYMNRKQCPILKTPLESGSVAVAYFSAEYGLHRSLPFYAGGLGFLAGDFLKESSDLNLPVVAVGFMYPEGYLHQKIGEDGWQENIEEYFDRDAAAISRVLNSQGNQLVVKVPVIEPVVHVAVWKVAVGRVPLFLLDTDIEQNDPWNRVMSARLYTGDLEQRMRQEIVLGIGGATVLKTLGVAYQVMHLNEGHAAFALLERIRDLTADGDNFEEAFEKVKQRTVFTTHTPVPAGHDVFSFQMMEKYFHRYWPALGIERERFLQLGVSPAAPQAGFNMTAFALRSSLCRNAVSKKHAAVTGEMWQGLLPAAGTGQEAMEHVTNGIHLPTWVEPKLKMLFDRYLGAGWVDDHDNPLVWEMIDKIPDQELWQVHYWMKIKLIDAVRERSRRRWVQDRAGSSIILAGGALLDPSVLTVGFARRFATYKRAALILNDLERLKRLVNDRWRPVQIIFAGKAHPADSPGKMILQQIFNACRNPELGGRIAFVEDYGEQLAQYLVHGVDLWLNTPLPPMEASGTSGMKAALNGVPQLSILDGWWIEGYNGKNGWAFEHRAQEGDRDSLDANEIYRLLEHDIIPLYYRVSDDGIPTGWVDMMKETIKASAARFSARRMVKDYVEKFYAPALEVKRQNGL